MIGEALNCQATTRAGRCWRCAVCRIVGAIENVNVDVNVEVPRTLHTRMEGIADALAELDSTLDHIAGAL